ncbi:winged helix DNA-binding domain-containing protein [Kaistia nematophila]|uniref:Winged helix DNA-binding domain-containing protein n=1 Tax=Kaistia nematophila TaxID=2994654 RepID=A0A9X3DZV9_9HYPH|nr:winged helix DNA-binding domain-containing protein [Kaistia nematophila]MCX5568812.1 winged helix DNA-binding domain-containing protein [Kaistia nematophila]
MTADAAPILSTRALNRALLARQMLLKRVGMPAETAIEHLVGLQSQVPANSYTALWSRLEGFRPEDVSELTASRKLVRIALMRGTLHLVTVADAVALRPVVQRVFEHTMTPGSAYGRALAGIDMAELIAAGERLLREKPLTNKELEAELAPQFPGRNGHALSHAVRALLPLVQVTPRGLWQQGGLAMSTTLDSWTGRTISADETPNTMIRRYLAAFGPASVADLQAWSGLTRLGDAVAGLRQELLEFRDEGGRVLFDLPDAPRPPEDTPAPPRLLPDYDNVVLGHAERSRIVHDDHRDHFKKENGMIPAFLIDGFAGGSWRIDRERGRATLTITPLIRLNSRDRQALLREAEALLAFQEPNARMREVVFADGA